MTSADNEQPASAHGGEFKPTVFISYSRHDLVVAERLREQLVILGFEAYLDKHEILPAEPWQERLGKLIELADTVAFLISPDSVASAVCDWEVNEAERLAKRILPVVVRDCDQDKVPGRLKRLNYIFLRSFDQEVEGIAQLSRALMTDIIWIRDQTRYQVRASEWALSDKAVDRLLFGAEIESAKDWLMRRPVSVTANELIYEFIAASEEEDKRRENITHIQYSRLQELFRFSLTLLKAELEVRKRHPVSHHYPNEAGELHQDHALEALLSERTRWHPLPAEEIGERGHYWIYRFPCCGSEIRRDDEAPSQFGPEGCTDLPQEVVFNLPASIYGSRLVARLKEFEELASRSDKSPASEKILFSARFSAPADECYASCRLSSGPTTGTGPTAGSFSQIMQRLFLCRFLGRRQRGVRRAR